MTALSISTQKKSYILACAGLAGGIIGFLIDYLLFRNTGFSGVVTRLLAGTGIALSFWIAFNLPRAKLPLFLILVPLLWVSVELIGELLAVKKPVWIDVLRFAGMSNRQLAGLYSNVSSLFSIVMMIISGLWLSLGLIIVHPVLKSRFIKMALLGILGGFVAVILTSILFAAIAILTNIIQTSFQIEAGSLSGTALFLNRYLPIAVNTIIAGIQIYCINLFMLIAIKPSTKQADAEENNIDE